MMMPRCIWSLPKTLLLGQSYPTSSYDIVQAFYGFEKTASHSPCEYCCTPFEICERT